VQLTIYRIKVSKKRLRGLNAYGAVADKDERLFGDRFGDSPVPVGILVHPDGKLAYVANTNATLILLDWLLRVDGELRQSQAVSCRVTPCEQDEAAVRGEDWLELVGPGSLDDGK
jgi:hypothetical protein